MFTFCCLGVQGHSHHCVVLGQYRCYGIEHWTAGWAVQPIVSTEPDVPAWALCAGMAAASGLGVSASHIPSAEPALFLAEAVVSSPDWALCKATAGPEGQRGGAWPWAPQPLEEALALQETCSGLWRQGWMSKVTLSAAD